MKYQKPNLTKNKLASTNGHTATFEHYQEINEAARYGERHNLPDKTLTTLGKLQPGDKFLLNKENSEVFIKVDKPAVKLRRHVYRCHIAPLYSCFPPFPVKENTEVIYLKQDFL